MPPQEQLEAGERRALTDERCLGEGRCVLVFKLLSLDAAAQSHQAGACAMSEGQPWRGRILSATKPRPSNARLVGSGTPLCRLAGP